MYRIIFSKSADKEFINLPKKERERFEKSIDGFSKNPFDTIFNIKRLYPPLVGYRLRIGKFRFLFFVFDEIKVIKIYRVSHRKDAYK